MAWLPTSSATVLAAAQNDVGNADVRHTRTSTEAAHDAVTTSSGIYQPSRCPGFQTSSSFARLSERDHRFLDARPNCSTGSVAVVGGALFVGA